ncbi:MAG: TIGR00303 family protein [Halococcoides sp.]
MTQFALVVGSTATARIPGVSGAGAHPPATAWTPAADAEIIAYGRPVATPGVPCAPDGTPTPAVLTRAALSAIDRSATVFDAGLGTPTAAPTVDVGDDPGGDIRGGEAVPTADEIVGRARRHGRTLGADHLVVGESIPGGTTTALALARAIDVDLTVGSSLPENPRDRKALVVDTALSAVDRGAPMAPIAAIEQVGDPVQAALLGLIEGGLAAGTRVTLAGGTQQLAIAAAVRARGVERDLEVATTDALARSVPFREMAARIGVEATVTPIGVDPSGPLGGYAAGIAKEGAGLGGALALVERADVDIASVRERAIEIATVHREAEVVA